ncbi:MAG: T9SS type A sorting domain-containing protein [Bacteroidales bacterium]|nr:T9SS type A sorting domain-containing protein [Bacteroidales bacterium]MCF8454963.1 T9SS type A sorting domain-containing protein [Bacteroidales bacterium]
MKTIKHIIVQLSLVLFTISSFGQWQWVKQGIADNSGINEYVIDTENNIYFTGGFNDSLVFGSNTFNCQGMNDIMIGKLNQNGELVWFKTLGGTQMYINVGYGEYGRYILHDNNSNSLIITGMYVFDGHFPPYTLPGGETGNYFIVKYDTAGNCLWANRINSWLIADEASSYIGNPVSDENSNIYLVGSNPFAANLEGGTRTSNDTAIHLQAGGYLAKYDVNGNILWAKNTFTGSTYQFIKKLQDKLIACGHFSDTISIDSIQLISVCDKNNLLLCQYDTSGNLEWYKTITSESNVQSYSFDVDANNNIVIAGSFTNNLIVDSDTLHSLSTNPETFLLKLNSTANLLWMQNFAISDTVLNSYYPNVSLDHNNNILLSGVISGHADFGTFSVESNTGTDQFIARFLPNGTCLGVEYFGKTERNPCRVKADQSNNLIVSGCFRDTLSIGNNTFISTEWGRSFFIAKHDSTITQIEVPAKSTVAYELIIIPNPNDGTCSIQFPAEVNPLKEAMLYIYDSEGRMLEEIPVLKNQPAAKIELDYLAKGIYLAKLVQGNKSYNGKIVFQ